MKKKRITLTAAVLAALLLLLGLQRLSPHLSTSRAQEAAPAQAEAGRDVPFKRYGAGQDLRELAKKRVGDVEIIETPPIRVEVTNRPPFIKAVACEADAVVVGEVRGKVSSQFTEGGRFIFTDFEMTVESVIKNNPSAPLGAGAAVVISRPGGELRLGDKTIRAVDESFKPFNAGGRYVFFLRYIPSAGSYQAFSNGSFQLKGGRVVPLGEGTLWGRLEGGEAAFLAAINEALADPCPPGLRALM